MKEYYLLRTLSDDPILITKEETRKFLQGVKEENFLLRKEGKLRDVTIIEKPPKLVLNFCEPLLIGVIQKSFLEELIPLNEVENYINFCKIFFYSKNNVNETEFLLYKCKHIIYTRANKTSFFIKGDKKNPTVYIPNGTPYITHIPSDKIPIYGSQIGELILREDLMQPIIGKKFRKLHVAKLKVQEPIDGFEFKDSISLE